MSFESLETTLSESVANSKYPLGDLFLAFPWLDTYFQAAVWVCFYVSSTRLAPPAPTRHFSSHMILEDLLRLVSNM